MEDSLSVGIKRKGKFYSYIEGEYFSFDLGRRGRLLNIDVWKPKKEWRIERNLAPPDDYERQDVIFLDFRLKTEPAAFYSNSDKTILHIRFAEGEIARFVSPANSLIFELSADEELIGLWVTQIEDDYGFRKESTWRKSIKSVEAD
jgi:hypothetical protein